MKLRISRHRTGWSLLSDGVLIGWAPTFGRACFAAAEWVDAGLYLTRADVR